MKSNRPFSSLGSQLVIIFALSLVAYLIWATYFRPGPLPPPPPEEEPEHPTVTLSNKKRPVSVHPRIAPAVVPSGQGK
jgi:hypothetical protein